MHSQIYERVKRVAAIATTELARAGENSAVQFVLKRNILLNFAEKKNPQKITFTHISQ